MGVDLGKAGCYLAGLLLGVAWWICADAAGSAAYLHSNISFDFVKYLPGIMSTLAFFLVNTLEWGMLSEDARFLYGPGVATRARCFVLFCITILLAALVGSILVLTHTYVNNKFNESTWPGVAIVLQNVCILLGTFVMRVGTIAAATT
ncbi:hypothetical protein PsorP6_011321 [Peronosclerospora sorghi]|uniref:Uncharacterized protein n=1 Tax=Peronosclerospora sorghi TaxID=230839 RepID=A0ACC0WIM9_9STRA|nr:hypothetical protein PsorP6_011321 [Peronosclerospora sorghi]